MIQPSQIRAARAMIGLTQAVLAAAAGISTTALNNIERGAADPKASTLGAIEKALRSAGVEFIPENGGGAGVRLAKPGPGHAASRDQAVSAEQQKANAEDVRTDAADAVDRVLADTDATKGEKAERRGTLTDEPTVVAAARGKGNPKRGNN